MKRLLLLTLCTLTTVSYAAPSASLANIQLPTTSLTFDGVNTQYPRDYELRYRGQEAELFTLENAVQSFLGDDIKYVESLEFSAIKLALMNKWFYRKGEDTNLMSKMRKYFCMNWKDKDQYNDKSKDCYNFDRKKVAKNESLGQAIEKLLSKKKKYTEVEAAKLAQDLIDKQFAYESQSSQSDRLVNYGSGRYQDFPVDVLFSTIYQENAMIYGDTILVMNSNDKRSIDLSYFNGVTNDKWGFRADAGEYITPGYIRGSELVGIHLRMRGAYPDKMRFGVRLGEYKVQQDAPISYAFYKHTYKNKDYVLIFDGKRGSRNTHCISAKDQQYRHCSWTEPAHNNGYELILAGYQALGNVHNYVPNLIGVLTLDDGVNKRPDGVFNQFKYFSDISLDQSLKNADGVGEASPINTLKDLSILKNGKERKVILHLSND